MDPVRVLARLLAAGRYFQGQIQRPGIAFDQQRHSFASRQRLDQLLQLRGVLDRLVVQTHQDIAGLHARFSGHARPDLLHPHTAVAIRHVGHQHVQVRRAVIRRVVQCEFGLVLIR